MNNSFIILGQQRSGTHLLATLLDSHSELKLFDEYYANASNYELPVKPIEELQQNEGMIIMYNHMVARGLKAKVKNRKVINIYRFDIRAQAISHAKVAKGGTAHSKNKVKENINVPESEIKGRMETIKKRQRSINKTIPENALQVAYEDITRNTEVRATKLPKICKYLGVENKQLTTNLKKINK